MEAELYGIYFENKGEMYLPVKGIKVPVLYLGEAQGHEIDVDKRFRGLNGFYLNDIMFTRLKILMWEKNTEEEIVTAKYVDPSEFNLESTLAELLDGNARDAILVIDNDSIRIDRVYDSNENEEKTWGRLLEGFQKLRVSSS